MRLAVVWRFSRVHLVALAGSLALVGTLTLAPAVPVAKAFAADTKPVTPRWYMLVNDYYDGIAPHPAGSMKCLSTNQTPPPGGANTHTVYLTNCNPAVAAQWWHVHDVQTVSETDIYSNRPLENLEEFGGVTWCLSANRTTPPGGSAGTHGAYTAVCSTGSDGPDGQLWRIGSWLGVNRWYIQNALNTDFWNLSASAANPYSGGGYRVYTSQAQLVTPSTPAQVWRLYRPTDPPIWAPDSP